MRKSFAKKSTGLFALALALGLSFNADAVPTNFSFAGTFGADDDVQLFSFTADGASVVSLVTQSYAGGTQANGNVVARGGFDPILALFNSSGTLVGQNDDSAVANCGGETVSFDPNTTVRYDTCFQSLLAAGDYTVAIMQYNNFALGPNLSNGFTHTGSPNFTGPLGGCSNGQFCDVSGVAPFNNRANYWNFDILNVEQAAQAPEPATLALLGLGLAGMSLSRRRKSS